jgi:hypothetical protein
MTRRTRHFVTASLMVLTIGIGTGLVAYYVGFQGGPSQGPAAELEFVPSDAVLVASADVAAVMVSDVRQKLLEVLPAGGAGRQEFEQRTGINIETDIDRMVACLAPSRAGGQPSPPVSGMVLARGRFDEAKIEALMRDHGARVEEYKGKRLIVAEAPPLGAPGSVSVAFLEPGLVALGSSDIIRTAVDLGTGGGNITGNQEVMDLVRGLDGTAWAVGRLDSLTSQARLPSQLAGQIPPVAWFSVTVRIATGVSGVLRADARDEASANSLRDIVRGAVAFARLQTSSSPQLRPLIDSLQLGGSGKSITLSFDVSPQMLDVLVDTLRGFDRGGVR